MRDLNPEPKTTTPARRLVLKAMAAAGLTGVAGGGFALWPARANAYYAGPVSDHFDGVRFYNPGQQGPKSIAMLLKWQLTESSERWPDRYPAPAPGKPQARVGAGAACVTYIGHASFLLQADGANILIDPVFAERASPVAFLGPKRVNPPGIAFDDLPPIDAVLITHNHYDHMDTAALARLWQRDRPEIVAPLGNDTILQNEIPGIAASTGDWGSVVRLKCGPSVHIEPTQHWSARGTRDRMHALWASFVIATSRHRIYAIGDTGFGDGGTFRAIAARHPGIDLALIPIGAYEPRWFMRSQHINPADAVEAFLLSGAKAAVGHHWGTFKLTNEGVERPLEHLGQALAARALPPERFVAIRPGAVRDLA